YSRALSPASRWCGLSPPNFPTAPAHKLPSRLSATAPPIAVPEGARSRRDLRSRQTSARSSACATLRHKPLRGSAPPNRFPPSPPHAPPVATPCRPPVRTLPRLAAIPAPLAPLLKSAC